MQYEEDVSSLPPAVSEQLSWSGKMGECTRDICQYFEGCDTTIDDWETFSNIIFAWSNMSCLEHIFNDVCSDYLRNEIYYYFSQNYPSDYPTTLAGKKK